MSGFWFFGFRGRTVMVEVVVEVGIMVSEEWEGDICMVN
jgi:hypothetical protein